MIFIQSLFRYTKSCFSQSQCTHSCVRSLLEKDNPHRKQVELDIAVAGRLLDLERRNDGTEKVRSTLKIIATFTPCTNASLSHDASKGRRYMETMAREERRRSNGKRGNGASFGRRERAEFRMVDE